VLVRRPERLRAAVPGLVLVLLAAVLAAPISAATTTVTGSLTLPNGTTALTPQAVAIVTIVDHTAAQDAGAIVGEQRIDAPGSVPIAFSVLIDDGAIDQTHAYGLYATVVDGTNVWQNAVGVPVVTGGPTSQIDVPLEAVPASPPATIKGTIEPPEGTRFGPAAVAITALI